MSLVSQQQNQSSLSNLDEDVNESRTRTQTWTQIEEKLRLAMLLTSQSPSLKNSAFSKVIYNAPLTNLHFQRIFSLQQWLTEYSYQIKRENGICHHFAFL